MGEAVTRMARAGCSEGYVVDHEQRYCGTVALAHLTAATEDGAAAHAVSAYIDPQRPLLSLGASIWDAMGELPDFAGQAIAVVEDPTSRRFVGVIEEATLTRVYMEKTDELRREEHGSG